MKINIFLLFLLGLYCIPFQVTSQNYFDIGNLSYAINSYDTGFQTNTLAARLNAALELKNKDLILISYQFENTNFQNLKETDLDLYGNALIAGYLHYWKNKQWSYVAEIKLKHNSDFYHPTIKDVQPSTWVLFNYKKSENLSLSAGLYYKKEFHKDLFFPISGLDWQIDEKWGLYIMIPSNIRLEYTIKKDNFYAGLETEWSLSTYRVKENDNIDFFLKENLYTYLFLEKKITGNFIAYLNLGNNQINKFEIYDSNDQIIPNQELDSYLLKNIGFRTGVAYRMRF